MRSTLTKGPNFCGHPSKTAAHVVVRTCQRNANLIKIDWPLPLNSPFLLIQYGKQI